MSSNCPATKPGFGQLRQADDGFTNTPEFEIWLPHTANSGGVIPSTGPYDLLLVYVDRNKLWADHLVVGLEAFTKALVDRT